MKKRFIPHFSLLFLILLTTTLLKASTHVINFSFPAYSTPSLSVFVGDTIIWKGDFSTFPLTSVSVPKDASVFGNNSGTTFNYVVAVEGTYKYQCETYKKDGMTAYFIALPIDSNKARVKDNAMVYINYIGHAFHITTTDAIPHTGYAITVTSVSGRVIYKSLLRSTEKEKWVATEEFPPGTYLLTATDGIHSFGKKFSK